MIKECVRPWWRRYDLVRCVCLVAVACALPEAACGSSSAGRDGDGGTQAEGGPDSSGGAGVGSAGSSSSGRGSSGTPGTGNAGASSDGASGGPGTASDGGLPGSSGVFGGDGGACAISAASVRVTEIDVGIAYSYQEVDTPLSLLAISPIPSGGSRLAFMGGDGMVHVARLDAGDKLVAASVFGLPASDFEDIVADDLGGVVLLSRSAMGGGTLQCGTPSNLCGTPPSPPIPCNDMYMVRFNDSAEAWATKLTTSSAQLPPYSTGPSGPPVYMIWWYAHNGRLASDGTNFAAYYGSAVSVSQGGCVNIHQGDEMRVVDPAGRTLTGGFDWGCSHSAFERMTWDGTKYVTVCNNDSDPGGSKTGQMAFAPNLTTIYPVNEVNAELGAVIQAGSGGYWLVLSDVRPGQSTVAPALDDVHLVHTTAGMSDKDITLASDTGLNDRAPHLAAFGSHRMLAAWETSTMTDHLVQTDTSRRLYVQALDSATGGALGAPYNVAGVRGSRYQDFRRYPDDSVAYAAPGSTGTKIKIVRITPCP